MPYPYSKNVSIVIVLKILIHNSERQQRLVELKNRNPSGYALQIRLLRSEIQRLKIE
jgi:hypothetical protein